jgi:hypothetical protein
MQCPGSLIGPYRYGIWVVNQPTGSGPENCPWGLVTKNTGITMINASAVTGTIHGMCIDMTGKPKHQPDLGGGDPDQAAVDLDLFERLAHRAEHDPQSL